MNSIFGKLHGMVYDDEENIPPSDVPSVRPTSPPYTPSSCIVPLDKLGSGAMYQGLLNKTSEDACPNLQKFRAMTETLKSAIPDELTRNKAALAASGVTVDAILSEITGLRNQLKDENDRGKQKLDDKEKAETTDGNVVVLEKEIATIQHEIAVKQAQAVEMRTTISAAKARISQKQSDFSAAVAKRSAVLDQLEKEINNLR